MYREDDLRTCIGSLERKKKYLKMFGKRMVVLQLIQGIECSLRYSGKYADNEIQKLFDQVYSQITKCDF